MIVVSWTGAEIRALRDALRLTQPAFAEMLGYSVDSVGKFERRSPDSPLKGSAAEAMDTVLDRLNGGQRARFFAAIRPTNVGASSGSLGSGAVAESGMILLPDADGAPVTAEMTTLVRDQVDAVLTRIGEDLMALTRRGFAKGSLAMGAWAATGPGSATEVTIPSERIDYLDYFNNQRKQAIATDNLFGSASVIDDVEKNLARMKRVRTAGVADPAAMLRLQVIFAEFAAWLYADLRNFDRAKWWTNEALNWAKFKLREDYYESFVLIRRAQTAAEMGDGEDSVDYATAAEQAALPDSKVAAAAVLWRGYGHALEAVRGVPDAHSMSLREFDRARSLLDRADKDSVWAFWLDHSYIDVYQARALTILGDDQRAVDQFSKAVDRTQNGYLRDKGTYLSWNALACCRNGDAEQAAALGKQALEIGIGTSSARILESVTELRKIIPASSEAGISAFRTRYDELTKAG